MITYKGFNANLCATMGRGTFQYEVGEKYIEAEANCAKNGFHSCNEPLGVLGWYSGPDSRYCVCEAGGEINEDGNGHGRVSSTELTLLKEVNVKQLAIIEAAWIQKHPLRENVKSVQIEKGHTEHGICVVRGKAPAAVVEKDTCLVLIQEKPRSKNIDKILVIEKATAGTYTIEGKRREKGRTKKTPNVKRNAGDDTKGKE